MQQFIMQVPPAIPTLAMCWLASVRHGATFIIDWHNFAYTLMRLSMSRRHPLVSPILLWKGGSTLRPSLTSLSLSGCLLSGDEYSSFAVVRRMAYLEAEGMLHCQAALSSSRQEGSSRPSWQLKPTRQRQLIRDMTLSARLCCHEGRELSS